MGSGVHMITSVRNRRVAQARRLHRSGVRRQEGLTLLEGPRLVSEGAEAGLLQTVFVATNADIIAEHAAEAATAAGAEVLRCSPHVVSAASESHGPQGIVAIGNVPHVDGLAEPALILVIDGIQDPGNLGSLVRTAAAAGASMIFRSPGSADPFSPKAMRAGAGAQSCGCNDMAELSEILCRVSRVVDNDRKSQPSEKMMAMAMQVRVASIGPLPLPGARPPPPAASILLPCVPVP